MCVHLGGRNVAVTHQFLQGAKICAIFQQMNSETMPQSMWGDLLLNMCGRLIVFEDFPETLTAHSCAVDVNKQRLLIG